MKLTSIQKEVLIGTVLGDGSLKRSRSGKSACLQICHSIKSKDYVEWKRQIFANWVFCEPKYHESNKALIFRTLSHPEIFKFVENFYDGKTKIVPKNIQDFLKSDLSLAVWFMDDGNGYIRNNGLRISTYSFGIEGNKLLQKCLLANFGIESTIFSDSKGFQLYIPIKNGNASKFRKLIKPYLLSSMLYKIENRSPVETHI